MYTVFHGRGSRCARDIHSIPWAEQETFINGGFYLPGWGLCIKSGKAKEHPDRICFVAAGNGTGAGTFPTETIKNAYIFQVGYHQGYGLTGALPDSHYCPQGYASGDRDLLYDSG